MNCLFRNKAHTKLMRWHKEEPRWVQWRYVDREFPYFDEDAKNIRFGLSMNGMNPFGEWDSSHNT